MDENAASTLEVDNVLAGAQDTADLATGPEAVDAVTVGTCDRVRRVALRLLARVLAVVGEATLGSGTELEAGGELLEDERDLDVVVVLALDGDPANSDASLSSFSALGRRRVEQLGCLVSTRRRGTHLLGVDGSTVMENSSDLQERLSSLSVGATLKL